MNIQREGIMSADKSKDNETAVTSSGQAEREVRCNRAYNCTGYKIDCLHRFIHKYRKYGCELGICSQIHKGYQRQECYCLEQST